MQIFYINLDSAKKRRADIEKSFSDYAPRGISIERFSAISSKCDEVMNLEGRISLPEKACFLSHKYLVQYSVLGNDHAYILEDDTEFCKDSFNVIDSFLTGGDINSWDIAFTEIGVASPSLMVDFFRLKKEQSRNKKILTLNLQSLPFFGATSYIVNSRFKSKYLSMLEEYKIYDQPYDMWLRTLIHQGKIRAVVLFPFPTTISLNANISSIQSTEENFTDTVWNLYRRFICLDSKSSQDSMILDSMSGVARDPEEKVLGNILSLLLSSKFKVK